jgi:formylglycine-generating enzyme required for sulfatase activity
MAKIFISYRRQDSAGVAGRIYDRLRAHFGNDAVFMDIDSIPYGVDFQKHIDSAVGQCDVVLTVIGTNWAGKTDDHRRIDDPKDFVRIEIEAALKREIPVIPILIDRTRMPTEAELPPSVARLTSRNAIDVDQGRDFHLHVDRLVRAISSQLKIAPLKQRNMRRLWLSAAAVPLVVLLSTIIYIVVDIGTFKIKRTDNKGEGASKSAASEQKSTSSSELPSTKPSPLQRAREWSNTIGMKLARIDAGEFWMGTTKEEVEQLMQQFPDSKREFFDVEKPQHLVETTRLFFLGVHEVTQGQYQAVMGNNPSVFKGSDQLPVENVTWLDAVGFCNKLSERENREPFYRIEGTEVAIAGGTGYRLPTEAEWEYACRAESATLYPFGDDADTLGEHAWYGGNAGGMTHPIGARLPNAWGLFDMLGNVWEWCSDGFDAKHSARSRPGDPPGGFRASRRVIRGGCWGDPPWGCRPASCLRDVPERRNPNLGFRVVVEE